MPTRSIAFCFALFLVSCMDDSARERKLFIANCREVEVSFGDDLMMMQRMRPDCFKLHSQERTEERVSSIKDLCTRLGGNVYSVEQGGVCSRQRDGSFEYLSLYGKEWVDIFTDDWFDCKERWFFDDTEEECRAFSSEFCSPLMLP